MPDSPKEKLIIDELKEFDELYNEEPIDDDDGSDGTEEFIRSDGEPESESEKSDEDGESREEDGDKPTENVDADSGQDTDSQREIDKGDPETPPDVDVRYEQLMAEINRLQGQAKGGQSLDIDKKPEPKTDDNKDKELDYFAETSLDDMLNDSSKMNTVFKQIADQAVKQALENLNLNVPGMVNFQVKEILSARDISKEFYKNNEDLSNVRNVVKSCADQVVQEHTDWTIEQILNESAKRTRQSLGMVDPATRSDTPSADKTGLAKGSKGKHKQTQKVSALQQELDEL